MNIHSNYKNLVGEMEEAAKESKYAKNFVLSILVSIVSIIIAMASAVMLIPIYIYAFCKAVAKSIKDRTRRKTMMSEIVTID